MNKLIVGCIVSIFFLWSCKNNKTENTQTEKNTLDTIPYYPYTIAIKKNIDSISNTVVEFKKLIKDSNSKETKSMISVNEFKQLASIFLETDITTLPLKKFYKESVFNDMTTVSTIINYTTKTDSLPVKNIDILMDATNTQRLKRVDIKKMYTIADTLITENCSWILDKEFYIIKIASHPNSKIITTQTKVIWQNK